MARKIRAQEYNGNTFFTSSLGMMKSENPLFTYYPAGMPTALDTLLALVAPTTGAIFSNAGTALRYQSYAYRVIWGKKDTNNNLVFGAPSQRQIIFYDKTVVAADRNVNVSITIPPYISTANYYQIYRTVRANSSVAFQDPGDEMYLVYEANPTAAQIAAGTITVEDFRPDVIKGPPLYTNASQQSINQANYPPPLCRDLALYRDHMFYAYTTEKEYIDLSVIGVSGFTTAVSTLTIGGVVFTAIQTADAVVTTTPTGENIAARQFVFYNTLFGTSPSEAIRGTAESLVRVINRSNNNFVAYYTSEVNDTPGFMFIENKLPGVAPFSIIADTTATGSNFEPKIPTSGTAVTSSNNERKNRIYFSKYQEVEHCPLGNYFTVGAEREFIGRILALRDSLIVIKEKSIWRVTGTGATSFTVSLLDNTVNIGNNYESAAVLNNTVICASNQGFVAISDTGVEIIGRPIEYQATMYNNLIAYDNPTDIPSLFGIGFESQRIYIASMRSMDVTGSPTYPYYSYVYNALNKKWSRWLINSNCFAIYRERLFYGMNNAYGNLMHQRYEDNLTTSSLNYDESCGYTVNSINTTNKTAVLTITYDVNYDGYQQNTIGEAQDGFGAGWILKFGIQKYLVLAWNSGTNTATLNRVDGLNVAVPSLAYRPIRFNVEWQPLTLSPETFKQFDRVVLTGQIDESYLLEFYFYNEQYKKTQWFKSKYATNPAPYRKLIGDLSTSFTPTVATNYRRVMAEAPKEKSNQLSIKVTNLVAGAKIAIKSLSVEVRDSGSEKSVR